MDCVVLAEPVKLNDLECCYIFDPLGVSAPFHTDVPKKHALCVQSDVIQLYFKLD